ncbi:MAG TPA: prolyl oligopeptidase family serine peptidase [Candidatus Limnocylindrales bacterium]|nr:prolyl oligopeptidase family serine peptidase [Candidatus Limnocylindrales bacterium]
MNSKRREITRALVLLGVFGVGILLIVPVFHAGSHRASTIPAPPVAPVRPVTDEYFGVKVVDPYRYMEDMQNPEVAAWFKGQNDYARAVLAAIPGRDPLFARIKALDEGAEARTTDVRRLPGDHYFYQKRLASEDVPKLYKSDGLKSSEKLLVDPKAYETPGGPHFAISYYAPSMDARYVAVGLSAAGSEDATLRVFDASTARETGDVIDRAEFGSPSWLPDGRSFVYNRLQKLTDKSAPTDRYLNSRAYLHVLGTSPDSDKLVFGTGVPGVTIDAPDIPFVGVAPGTSYALGLIAHGVRIEVTMYVAPLESLGSTAIPWKRLCDVDDDVTNFDVHGDDIYLVSHHEASRFKVLRAKMSSGDLAHAEVVVPPSDQVIQNVAAASDAAYVQALDGGIGRLWRLPYAGGKAQPVPLPLDGAVVLAASDQRVPGIVLELTSWTRARKIYAYDSSSNALTDTKLQPVGKFDEPTDLESHELKVKSYDGTMVPLSVVYKKGLKLDGKNPTLLEGYGSYGITLDPYFDARLIAWYEQGGVFAVAHVRGGGEYGEDWHLAGKLLTKPNTWRDFIAAAEYLIAQKYTDTPHLAIEGGSAGGITIGRSITDRPDLFAAAIDAVPESDTLRSEFTPNGPPNIPEFGTVKEADGFKALYEMSSYLHVKDGTKYPAVLLTTGFNDPRVISWQPGKMAARLEAATGSSKPVLLRVDYDAGHGIGSTKTQREQELADEFSFMLWQFGAPSYQPAKP